jgi:multidrug efflux pump subunit AcrB
MSNTDDCTLQTCPISEAYVEYQPNKAGNIFYLALFAVLLVAQIGTGIKFRSWSFMAPMIAGLILEIIGYLGRILLHDNPFSFSAFLM